MGVALALAVLAAGGLACRESRAGVAPDVDPVSGPSLLRRANLALDATRLGQLGGLDPASVTGEPMPTSARANVVFSLAGADLYRLGCRPCHGAGAKGAPPEVNDLLGPASATSPALVERRMRELDRPVDESFVRELATQSTTAVGQQIRAGGPKMPAFGYLRAEEVDAIVCYLRELAGAPASPPLRLNEPAPRVGELLVKGTCHVCHDATGPGAWPMMMMHGGIPSLESLPRQWSMTQVVDKVREGRDAAMPMMHMMRMHGRARMPLYPYFTPQEVAAAYVYLASVPPRP